MHKFLRACDSISEWSGKIFMWLIIPLTGLVAFEVISRRFFNAPHIWSLEVTNYLYGPHFMIVAAYTLLHKGHVAIDLVYNRFPPRIRGVFDIITYSVLYFPFCILMAYHGTRFAATSWAIHETSESAALGVVPLVKTVIPVTFVLLIIQGIANFIRSIGLAVKGEEI